MEYLIKASAILGIFYVFYKLVLQRETFFQSNRIFLLMGIVVSLVIPLIVIPIYVEQTPITFSNAVYSTTSDNLEVKKTIDWLQIAFYIYICGVMFFGGKLLLSLSSIVLLVFKSPKKVVDGFYFIESKQNASPFSFFNYIIINKDEFKDKELDQIVTHEKVHASQKHSLDVLLAQLISVVFWFNPISWFYKKEVQQNLEFIADSQSIKETSCQKSYQQLLLKSSISQNQLALTNNFYNSLIKKRIIMIHKNKSNKFNQLKFALILPILTAFILSFNTKVIAQTIKVKKINENQVHEIIEVDVDVQMVIITKDSDDNDLDNIKNDLSKEGITAKFKGVKRNDDGEITAIKIDLNSKQSNANYTIGSGTPINPIKISFDEKGDNIAISNGSLHSNNEMIFVTKHGNETIEVVGYGNDHEIIEIRKADDDNSNVWVTKDGDKHQVIDINQKDGNYVFISSDQGEKPLIIVDGEVSLKSVEDLDPDTIGSINVVKGESAIKLYGDKAEHGVVLVTTKEKSDKTIEVVGYGDIDGKKPLFIIDGEESNQGIEDLNPDDIESMNVLKGESAIKKYGDKAKDGVIEITTKKK